MSHDTTEPHADKPTQSVFIGWLAIGLLALMAVFALVLFFAGAMYGFQ